jgi:hypothetical protein
MTSPVGDVSVADHYLAFTTTTNDRDGIRQSVNNIFGAAKSAIRSSPPATQDPIWRSYLVVDI